jgi:hypothetical protein
LTALPGVGPRSARCVHAYSLERQAFAVDTHLIRARSFSPGRSTVSAPRDYRRRPGLIASWLARSIRSTRRSCASNSLWAQTGEHRASDDEDYCEHCEDDEARSLRSAVERRGAGGPCRLVSARNCGLELGSRRSPTLQERSGPHRREPDCGQTTSTARPRLARAFGVAGTLRWRVTSRPRSKISSGRH